jgi:UDP-GlcNAc:undecaprenyl-phosphate GlcNAc-1-phosphate transferase
MDALQFLPIMVVGFAASLGLTPVSRQIAMRLGVVDKPNARKIHLDNKPLMGGLAIYVAFALALLLFSPPQYVVEFGAVLSGGAFLAFIGFLDDRQTLAIRTRLIAMVVAAAVLVAAGIRIRLFDFPLLDIPITIFWVVSVCNAVNFLDNMDGLAAGLTSIAAAFFLLIAISKGLTLVSSLAAALLGSAVGFLVYNFNPSSTFMGDMGALVLGFVLSVLSIKIRFDTPPFDAAWLVPLFVLILPVFDINLVVFTRLFEGRSPGQAGKDHTSHRLMSVGFSQRQTLFILYGGCLLFGALGLVISAASPALGWQVAAVGLALIAALYALMIYVREKVQKAK